jgi:hypothetical protein
LGPGGSLRASSINFIGLFQILPARQTEPAAIPCGTPFKRTTRNAPS